MGGSGDCLAPLGGDHGHHHRPGHERRCDADVGVDSGAAGLGQLATLGVLDEDGCLVLPAAAKTKPIDPEKLLLFSFMSIKSYFYTHGDRGFTISVSVFVLCRFNRVQ